MNDDYKIYKAAGIIIRDRKLLVTKSRNKDIYVAPGGKLESGESPEEAVMRELEEELQIRVRIEDLKIFGTFYADAAGLDNVRLRMDCFVVTQWQGDFVPSSEIEKILWIDSDVPEDIKVGSIFEHEVIPRLKEMNLID